MKWNSKLPLTDEQRDRLTQELERAFKRHEGHRGDLRQGRDGTHYCPQCYPRWKIVANWLRKHRLRTAAR